MRAPLALVSILVAPILAAEQVPQDVDGFLRRAELCAHFRQEPWPEGTSPHDVERRGLILKQTERFCAGLPEESRHLREKYRDEPLVIKELDKANGWDE